MAKVNHKKRNFLQKHKMLDHKRHAEHSVRRNTLALPKKGKG